MQLWSDYEGKTLAGTFPIEALLLTEGRNASFATHDRSGRPAVLRLTEALNDQDEMRARYGAIRDVGQPNLVAIEDYGDVEMEGTPLIYLVMEPTQESLADIIRERKLSIEETGEVATALVNALEALHSHGLVHGNVEPESVLAAGQVIKLRSDCVRPAPLGEGGDQARALDVFGLADVLHRSLTQQPLIDASDALALPEPYASIVRNVARGSWALDKIAAEVRWFVRPPAPAVAASAPTPLMEAPVESARIEYAEPVVAPQTEGAAPDAAQDLHMHAAAESPDEQVPMSRPTWAAPAQQQPHAFRRDRSSVAWAVGAVAVCVLGLLVWRVASGTSHTTASLTGTPPVAALPAPASVPAPAPAAVTAAAPPIRASLRHHRHEAAVSAPAVVSAATAAAPLHGGKIWRVVAYTYNVEAQAEKKANSIRKSHADLNPSVFSPTGHAPYLVTVGGSLSEEQAKAMRARARGEGLARDVYMQNYSH